MASDSMENMSLDDVLRLLDRKTGGRTRFESSGIIGSMCSSPHNLGAEVFRRCLETNIGDPGIFPEIAALEQDALRMIARLISFDVRYGGEDDSLRAESRDAAAPSDFPGTLTSGGTEANILAMWAARKHADARSSTRPRQVLLSEAAHFSFEKAADLMDFELRRIPVDFEGRMDMSVCRQLAGAHTMALVGVAGTTGLGAVDDLRALSDIAQEHDLYLHVDAAFGGFVLPFLQPGCFDHPGISSITIDPHKMGRAPIPAGAILYRSRELADYTASKVSYLAGGTTRQKTIVGTRSGAAAASVWALLTYLGRKGYEEIVARSCELTSWFCSRIKALPGVELFCAPKMNVVGLCIPSEDSPADERKTDEIEAALKKRGWALSRFPKFLRIVMMPHVRKKDLEMFLDDLAHILQ